MVGLIFSPVPLALLGVRENKGWMAAGVFLAGTLLLVLFGPVLAFYFLLEEGLVSFALTLSPKAKMGNEALFFCTVVSIVSKVLFMAVDVVLTGHNPFLMEASALRSAVMQMYSGLLSGDAGSAAALKDSMEQIIALAPYMVPSLILSWSMLDSFLNYRLCETLQRLYGLRNEHGVVFPPLPPFGSWRFPKSILWPVLLALVLPLLPETEGSALWLMLEINLKFLVSVFFFLEGMSLVWWWLMKRRIHFVLRILMMTLLTLPILGLWMVGLGVADICFDLRTLKDRSARKKMQ
jgi:uncharacterized protein YybS (DUF2232 family)